MIQSRLKFNEIKGRRLFHLNQPRSTSDDVAPFDLSSADVKLFNTVVNAESFLFNRKISKLMRSHEKL